MDLWNAQLEISALKTAMSDNEIAEKMFLFLEADHFFQKHTRELFLLLDNVINDSGHYPSWRLLVKDSRLGVEVQDALLAEFETCEAGASNSDFNYLAKSLDDLRSKRRLYAKVKSIDNGLREEGKSLDEIANEFGDALAVLDSSSDDIPEMVFGADYNLACEQVFNDLVYGSGGGTVIPTGFKAFDARSKGFQRSNLVIWGATSGGGKSVMAINLLVRQYLMGHTVVLASYEMNFHEIQSRINAIISEVPLEAVTTNNMTYEQKMKLECAFREFNLVGAKNGNSFYIACPTSETTVSKLARKYKAIKPTAIIYDYINLLTSHSKHADSQWQVLGEIAKEAKMVAVQYNCVVHLLAQIDEEHKIRYSKAIKDHANWFFGWVYDDEARANGFVTVKQMKARNAPVYDFQLLARFDIGQFRDPDEEDKNVNYTQRRFDEIQTEAREAGVLLQLPSVERADESQAVQEVQPKQVSVRSYLDGEYEDVI